MKTTYPYRQWRLMPSYKPVEVEIVGPNTHYWRRGNPVDSRGKVYDRHELFDTKEKAIAYGHIQLDQQQEVVSKRQASINARRAALEKAGGHSA